MLNLGKVITGFAVCEPSHVQRECGKCPYREEQNCDYVLYHDVGDTLKTMNAVKVNTLMVTPRRVKGVQHGRCPNCDEWINSVTNKVCCGKCGQRVMWE